MYAMIMIMLSPGRASIDIKGIDGQKILTAEETGMLNDDEAFGLLQQRAFLSSALARAKYDSIGLSVDLPGRSFSLELNGVKVFSSTIEDNDISPYFKSLSDTIMIYLSTLPAKVVASRSTIIKEPIIEKKAPKDTSEVQLDAIQLDTSYREPAFLIMELDNGIRLIVRQQEGLHFQDRFKLHSFIFKERLARTGNILRAIFSGRVPEYIPSIKLEIPAKDIRVIYRALPRHPLISLRIE